MSGFDRYAQEQREEQRCPKCRRLTLGYDKVLKAWACISCRWRDR